MHQLTQSLEREGSSRFGFLSRGLAFLARPSVAVWAPIPLRLIVGYGFMEHGSRNCPGGLKPSPRSCIRWACPRLISWHGSPF